MYHDTGFGGGFDFFSNVFPLIFIGMFLLVFFVIISNVVVGLKTWKKNNDSPRLHVMAKVIGKRADVSHRSGSVNHHNDNHVHHSSSSSTSYYVTF